MIHVDFLFFFQVPFVIDLSHNKVSFSSSQGAQSPKRNDLQHHHYIKLLAMPQTSEVCFTNIDF